MARQTNGTNQSLQTAAAIDLSSFAALSISVWVYWDTFANNNALLCESANDFDTVTDGFIVNPNEAGTGAGTWTTTHGGNGNYNGKGFTRPSAQAWHHYVVTRDRSLAGASEIVSSYIDSVSQSLTTLSSFDTTGNFGNRILYLMSRGNSSLWAAGRIAELAIYGGLILDQTDVTRLYNKGRPLLATLVQSGSLVHYWRLQGTTSPEPATTGSTAMTVNGATAISHPPGTVAEGSFETGDFSEVSSVVTPADIVTSPTRFGNYAARMTSDAADPRIRLRTGLNLSSVWVRGYMRLETPGSDGLEEFLGAIRVFQQDGTTEIARISTWHQTDNTIALQLGNRITFTDLGSRVNIMFNRWYMLELKVVVSATVGVLEWRLDGTVRHTATSQNTGSSNVERVNLYGHNHQSIVTYWDQWEVNDAQYPDVYVPPYPSRWT